ncbi:MAG: hypothetical protein WCA28_06105 [Bradyrhizobium sp.]
MSGTSRSLESAACRHKVDIRILVDLPDVVDALAGYAFALDARP